MYQVDQSDEVVQLRDVPLPDGGAPFPAVIAAENHLALIYLVRDPDPDWDGTHVDVVGPGSKGKQVARIRFHDPYAHMFGPPNDEAFSGHPLAARGLHAWATWEILHSSWVRALERMNSVHPYHRAEHFADYRHFIFAFHDTTFECVARGYTSHIERGSIASVAAALPAGWE
jgi:hypothetical protein